MFEGGLVRVLGVGLTTTIVVRKEIVKTLYSGMINGLGEFRYG